MISSLFNTKSAVGTVVAGASLVTWHVRFHDEIFNLLPKQMKCPVVGSLLLLCLGLQPDRASGDVQRMCQD